GAGVNGVFTFAGAGAPAIRKATTAGAPPANTGYTLLVSAPGYDTVSTPFFNVLPDVNTATLAFTQQPPSTVTASSVANFQATVQVQDKWGNPINGAATIDIAAPALNGQ